jgi:hypothetical protein
MSRLLALRGVLSTTLLKGLGTGRTNVIFYVYALACIHTLPNFLPVHLFHSSLNLETQASIH